MTAAKPRRPWWPFWVVMMLYVIVRPMFMQADFSPVTMIVSLVDPITLILAVGAAFGVRACFPRR